MTDAGQEKRQGSRRMRPGRGGRSAAAPWCRLVGNGCSARDLPDGEIFLEGSCAETGPDRSRKSTGTVTPCARGRRGPRTRHVRRLGSPSSQPDVDRALGAASEKPARRQTPPRRCPRWPAPARCVRRWGGGESVEALGDSSIVGMAKAPVRLRTQRAFALDRAGQVESSCTPTWCEGARPSSRLPPSTPLPGSSPRSRPSSRTGTNDPHPSSGPSPHRTSSSRFDVGIELTPGTGHQSARLTLASAAAARARARRRGPPARASESRPPTGRR